MQGFRVCNDTPLILDGVFSGFIPLLVGLTLWNYHFVAFKILALETLN